MFSLKVETPDLETVAARLGRGTELRRKFGKEMRKIAKVAVQAERAHVLGLNSSAKHTQQELAYHAANKLRGRKNITEKKVQAALKGAGLRSSIANSINAIIRYQGKDVGVRVRAQTSKMPPGMQRLPALTNKGSWTHPIFGKGGPRAVTQKAAPPQWWWKARDEVKTQVQGDFERLLQEYGSKIING